MAVLNLDFETRSTLDLTRVGAEKYARHSSTRVLCASFSIDNGPVTQWRAWAGQPLPAELAAALDDPDTEIHAWAASFERQILKHVLKRDLPPSRFRCTQARARSMALPGKLELCAKALAMPIQKADSRVMMKWCKPLPSGGWADDPQEYSSLCGYCDVDVLTEQGLGGLLRHLSPEEQRDWCITEYVNQNGIPIDIQLVQAAQRYAADEMQEIKQRLSDITHGVVTSPKQFQRLKDWLAPEIEVDSLDATVREGLLDDPSVQGDIREVIQLVDDGGRASTAKFAAMENRADDKGRVHGAYIFNGAGQTGRFCVAAETLVETDLGPRPIATLRRGDNVLTHKGRFRPVLNLFYKGQEEMYNLSFANGSSVVCTAAHRLLTTRGWCNLVSTGSLSGTMPRDTRSGLNQAIQNTARTGRDVRHLGEIDKRGAVQKLAFKSNQRTLKTHPQKYLSTVFGTAISNAGADCKAVRGEASCSFQSVACRYPAQDYTCESQSQLFAVQDRRAKPILWGHTRNHTGLATRLRGGLEWARLYAITSKNDGRGAKNEASAIMGAGSPHRWEQSSQRTGQFCISDNQGSSYSASTALEKIEAVGVRGVWDIEVEEDHSYVAQGLIHHNSSTGAQLHNFIRDKLKNTEDVVDAILAVFSKDDLIKIAQFPEDYTGARNILTILSRLLRPSLVAPDGKTFVWGDWKAIEARVLPWLSLENSASQLLDLFADNEDVYKHQASGMFGVRVEEVSDGQRQRGKVAILSLGYGGGAGALIAMARNYGLIIDEETAEMYKRTWRQTNPWAQRFWNALEAAIYNAVRNPGAVFSAGRVRYLSTEAVLWCLLPCGRMLAYPFPKIETRPGRFGPSDQVTCIKGAWAPKKGMNYWPRMSLWGGLAAENCTQGVAASLLRWSQRELADNGWLDCLVGHTHDENLLEVDDAEVATAREVLSDIMVGGPGWAAGLPLAVDMMSGAVYGK